MQDTVGTMDLELRRSAELELVASAYGQDEAWWEDNGQGCHVVHRRLSLNHREHGSSSTNDVSVVMVRLSLTMPSGYPLEEPLEISATIEKSLQKDAWDALPCLLESCRQVAKSLVGDEAVWAVINRAEEWTEREWPSFVRKITEDVPSTQLERSCSAPSCCTLGRRLIYSHHIIAASKRTAIRELSSYYSLTGYVKIGWPGIIIVEGREEHCVDFVDEIRSMSWQYLVVRGEQQQKVSSSHELEKERKFSGFLELDGMSILAQKCRDAGLETLFRTCMKHYKEEDEIVEEIDNDELSCYGALVRDDDHNMNSGKNYRKWLRKTGNDCQCSLLIRKCVSNPYFIKRPILVVGVIGARREDVHQFLKRWRASRIDVTSNGQERKLTVLIEGPISKTRTLSRVNWEDLQAEDQVDSSFESTVDIVGQLGGKAWADALEKSYQC